MITGMRPTLPFPVVLLVLLLMSGSVLLTVACRSHDAGWERVSRSGTLRVGLDPTFPPFEWMEGEQVVGLDVDLARALGEVLGVTVQFDLISHDALYDALVTQRVDLLASALVIDPLRTRQVAYSTPYFNAGELLVSRSGEAAQPGPGRRVAVELGATGHLLATEWQRQWGEMELLTADSAENALRLVREGSADFAVVDAVTAHLLRGDGLQIAPDPLTVEPFALALRSDHPELLQRVNAALDQLAQSGRLDAIITRRLTPPTAGNGDGDNG
jgi:polar amino acid transport system substrate-binding protein